MEDWETFIDENGVEYWIIDDDGKKLKVSKEFLRKSFDHSW